MPQGVDNALFDVFAVPVPSIPICDSLYYPRHSLNFVRGGEGEDRNTVQRAPSTQPHHVSTSHLAGDGVHLVAPDERHDMQQVEHMAVGGAERVFERLQRQRTVGEWQPAELAALGPSGTVAAILGGPLCGCQVPGGRGAVTGGTRSDRMGGGRVRQFCCPVGYLQTSGSEVES